MSRKPRTRSRGVAPPDNGGRNSADPVPAAPDANTEAPRFRRRFPRWRALTLSLVYVVFAVHIIHWKITGKTLAPLELNEVMYTLELGIVTAGFLFMCFLALGTLVFGRFFCSWACHIMVLQDLCAWLLRKLGIRRKPLRSRLLLLVPPLTAAYMFLWPQIRRAWQARAFPEFHWASDAEGWASLVTQNFWRNLPGPAVIVLTFLVCGFAIVYLLGSRTFCTYVCPYGAIFAFADRFSPGKIRVNDKCKQCGTCTRACTSGVRVHDEVRQHGAVVNSACLKCMDCVSVCPQDALHYGFGAPGLFKSRASGGRFGRLPYDFKVGEELLIAAVFLVVVLSFRGLYSRIPFLLSLGLGGIFGYAAVVAVRLLRRPNVVVSTLPLRRSGRFTPAGWVFTGVTVLLAGLVGHSALVRYHEFTGLAETRQIQHMADPARADALTPVAYAHLTKAERWGLMRNPNVERCLLALSSRMMHLDDVVRYAERLLARFPQDAGVRLQLGLCFLQQGRADEAEGHLRQAVALRGGNSQDAPRILLEARQALAAMAMNRGDFAAAAEQLSAVAALQPDQAPVHAQLGGVLAEIGRFDEALDRLADAIRIDPELAEAHYNRGAILGRLGRFEEAVPCYERAVFLSPADAVVRNNLGFALMKTGRSDDAEREFEQAVALDPDNSDAQFNLGRLLADRGRLEQAAPHLRAAARLDPRYAKLLGQVNTGP